MNIKLRSMSSIFKLGKNRFGRENKIEMTTTSALLTKNDIANILKSVTSVIPQAINTLNVKKCKFGRGGNIKGNHKYLRTNYYKRVVLYKKIIITFDHSRNKVKFLSDFGIN